MSRIEEFLAEQLSTGWYYTSSSDAIDTMVVEAAPISVEFDSFDE